MSRGTWVWDKIKGEVVPKGSETMPATKRVLSKTPRAVRKGRFIWDRRKRDFVPAEQFYRPGRGAGLQVIRDIDPYRSTVTGEAIGGRRQHRDHLRAHGCVEVGNEMPKRPPPMPDREGVRQELKRALEIGMPPEIRHAVERAKRAI